MGISVAMVLDRTAGSELALTIGAPALTVLLPIGVVWLVVAVTLPSRLVVTTDVPVEGLFAELLRLELAYREPALVPVLHRRAAAWHRQAGNVEEVIGHATAAGSSPKPRR